MLNRAMMRKKKAVKVLSKVERIEQAAEQADQREAWRGWSNAEQDPQDAFGRCQGVGQSTENVTVQSIESD